MKIIKHIAWAIKMIAISLSCKHLDSSKASCPYTNKTYVTCNRCSKRLSETQNDS